jgi:Na+-driven multidrug efflux pump
MAAVLSLVPVSLCALVFVAAPRRLVAGFSADPAVVAVGARALLVAAAAQPFMALAVVTAMGLRGAGDTRTVLGATAVCALGVRLAATWTLAMTLGLGLTGVWLGSAADWIVRAGVLAAAYGRGRWRRRRV